MAYVRPINLSTLKVTEKKGSIRSSKVGLYTSDQHFKSQSPLKDFASGPGPFRNIATVVREQGANTSLNKYWRRPSRKERKKRVKRY